MARRTRLVDCNPKWVMRDGIAQPVGVSFDCPEGHVSCWHSIPFAGYAWREGGATWERRGETFETLSLTPSIRRLPVYKTREEALARGALPEYLTDELFCAMHIYITNGKIEFCGDSK